MSAAPAEEKLDCYAAESSKAYAVFEAKGEFKPHVFKLRKLGPVDVEVKITHAGICHSDLHTIDGDWGPQPWPLVPGHEIVGTISALGADVAKHRPDFKVGMRVGVGCQAASCHSCKPCKRGEEQYCREGMTATYGKKLDDGYVTQGGYAEFHRTDCRFAFAIPDSVESANAAPLLCAGVTVWTPLRNAKVGPGSKVGIIGIGGLGHMALQFANALCCDVTAISGSPAKEAMAKELGAHHFLLTSDEEAMKAAVGTFDMLLNTVSATLDYPKIINLMVPRGIFATVGAPPTNIQLNPFDLILKGYTIMGSLIGSPSQIEEMFELCGKKNIAAKIELLPFNKVNEGIQKVRDNNVKFRVVLEMDTNSKHVL